jgi:hypothetical protein
MPCHARAMIRADLRGRGRGQMEHRFFVNRLVLLHFHWQPNWRMLWACGRHRQAEKIQRNGCGPLAKRHLLSDAARVRSRKRTPVVAEEATYELESKSPKLWLAGRAREALLAARVDLEVTQEVPWLRLQRQAEKRSTDGEALHSWHSFPRVYHFVDRTESTQCLGLPGGLLLLPTTRYFLICPSVQK